MATIIPTLSFHARSPGNTHIWLWEGLGENDDGDWVDLLGLSVRTFAVGGDFDTGSTIVINGTNTLEPETVPESLLHATLTDTNGVFVNLEFTDSGSPPSGVKTSLEMPRYCRPVVSAGADFTDASVLLIAY
jgi:hypothetical protein